MTNKDDVRRAALVKLIADKEPDRCSRCGGGPGDPGCGKIIHLIMDEVFMDAAQKMGLPEEEAEALLREEE